MTVIITDFSDFSDFSISSRQKFEIKFLGGFVFSIFNDIIGSNWQVLPVVIGSTQ